MKKPDPRKVLTTLADMLSVQKTCKALGIERSDLRDALLEILAGDKPRESPEDDFFIIHVDGASRGNPGPAGAGVLISKRDGMLEGVAQFLGEQTNNQAEYEALIIGLERLVELGARKVEVRSDSELMVKQIRGEYKVRNKGLKELYSKAKGLIKGFEKFSIKHIPREDNSQADGLANRAIDEFSDP